MYPRLIHTMNEILCIRVIGQQNDGFFSRSFSQNTMSDLQRVNKALTEKLSEKELALKHQRNTNR